MFERNLKTIILTIAVCCAASAWAFGQTANSIVYEGKLLDGAKWTDNNGENYLIVSGRETRRRDQATTQHLYAYQYATKNGRTKLLWKIYDFAENECDAGSNLVSPIFVQDIDDDGVAENMFVYNVQGNCDVSPQAFKLMLHSGAAKYAIRGTNSVKTGGVKVGGAKNFDDAFSQAPVSFKNAASAFWDKYVKDIGSK